MSPKIGLVGCGRWGRHILRDLKSIGCDVSVVARSNASIANAREHGANQIVDSAEALESDISGFVVASPTVSHLSVTRALVGRGKPIFVEKPLTNDLAGARSLFLQAPAQIFVMYKWRYHPGIQALRSIAVSGEFGPVLGLRSTRTQWSSPHSDVDPVWILAPHDISIATHIFGEVPEPIRATADPIGPAGSGLTAELLDKVTGARVAVTVSASSPSWKREVVLGCHDAVVSMSGDDYTSLEVRSWPQSPEDQPEMEKRVVDDRLPLLAELEAFVGYVCGGPTPLTGLEEELRILETLARLRQMAGFAAQTSDDH